LDAIPDQFAVIAAVVVQVEPVFLEIYMNPPFTHADIPVPSVVDAMPDQFRVPAPEQSIHVEPKLVEM
jgi:hypothetical protein